MVKEMIEEMENETGSKNILRIYWSLPIESRVYQEIGKVMVHILPLISEVQYADSEGAIIRLHEALTDDQKEGIREMRDTLYYVDVWFEGEDLEKIQKDRILRWAKKTNFK